VKAKIIVTGFTAAVLTVLVAVPALAAGDTPQQARASAAGDRNALDLSLLPQRVTRQIDAAVAAGWLRPKLAVQLKQELVTGARLAGTRLDLLELRLVAWAAEVLGTSPGGLRGEIRSGLTLDQILKAHRTSANTLFQRLGWAARTFRLWKRPNATASPVQTRVAAPARPSLAPQR
jgi:hypothetical protein